MRDYRRGDDLRRVHWRSSARTGELMVRREEQPWQSRATLFLDNRARSHRGQGVASSLEAAVSAAASVAMHLSSRGFAVRLVTAAGEDPANAWHVRDTDLNTGSLLEALAVVQPLRSPRIDTGWLTEQARRRPDRRRPRRGRGRRRTGAAPDGAPRRHRARDRPGRRRLGLAEQLGGRLERAAGPDGLAVGGAAPRRAAGVGAGRTSAVARPPRCAALAHDVPSAGASVDDRPAGQRRHRRPRSASWPRRPPGRRCCPGAASPRNPAPSWCRCWCWAGPWPAPARWVAGRDCRCGGRASPAGAALGDGRQRAAGRVAAAPRAAPGSDWSPSSRTRRHRRTGSPRRCRPTLPRSTRC